MPRKKEESLAEWITSAEAAKILSENSEHQISDAYVRRLGNTNKIATKQIDLRTKLYKRSEVEAYRVAQRGKGEKTEAESAA